MGALSRLEVPIVFGSLRDRWFAVAKPPGLLTCASPPLPSVEATLRPFCEGGRELSFPFRLERDAQGLLLVTTDEAMRKCFSELVRQRLIRSTFRVLADVSRLGTAKMPGSLAAGRLVGSLRQPEGGLARAGVLHSAVAQRPLRLAPRAGRLPAVAAAAAAPRAVGGAQAEASAWGSALELREGLEGTAVPKALRGVLLRSLLASSRSPQSLHTAVPPAATEFELVRGPVSCPADPGVATALYLARPRTSAGHQLRVHFAEAGCPVMFDPYYHPAYNLEVRRKAFGGAAAEAEASSEEKAQPPLLQGTLGLQLCRLELPDPLQPGQDLRLSLPAAPEEWELVQPSDGRWLAEDPGAVSAEERQQETFR